MTGETKAYDSLLDRLDALRVLRADDEAEKGVLLEELEQLGAGSATSRESFSGSGCSPSPTASRRLIAASSARSRCSSATAAEERP